jgi:hypothetical protein
LGAASRAQQGRIQLLIKVNYTCDLDGATAIASCSWDKTTAQGQLATFAYVFVWKEVSPDANGWKNYQPLVSWGIASPGTPVRTDPSKYRFLQLQLDDRAGVHR